MSVTVRGHGGQANGDILVQDVKGDVLVETEVVPAIISPGGGGELQVVNVNFYLDEAVFSQSFTFLNHIVDHGSEFFRIRDGALYLTNGAESGLGLDSGFLVFEIHPHRHRAHLTVPLVSLVAVIVEFACARA